jgi:photosystem II stability/assembly factor-like uncharacterized protein
MKKIILFIFIFCNSINIIIAQNGWQQLSSFTTTNLSHAYFVNANTGIITAYSPVIYRSTNGGSTWSQFVYSNTNVWFWGIEFINESTGWVIGYNLNSPYNNAILKTTNSGINWTEQFTGTGQMREVFFINSSTGFVSGELFYKTTNAGINWIAANPPGYVTGLGLFFWDQNTGWIGGGSSTVNTIISTTNGGTSWSSQLPISGHLYDILFFTAQSGFAAGPNGIIRTSNGGINWASSYYTTYGGSLSFPNNQTGWATVLVSNPTAGKLIKTTDAGMTWVIQSLNDPRIFGRVFMLNVNTGWVVGDEGVIYKTTNGGELGIQPVSSEIPDEYSLAQNYPNPFNPSTKIKFDIPLLRGVDAEGRRGVLVELIIYDILGREIAKLVNEKLKPGVYEVEFDGTNYPSGVYFYKLETEHFTETKKMILLK